MGMAATQLKVMLIEDHVVVRETLQEFIGTLPQVSDCGAAASAEAALVALDRSVPDLVLIDLSLPGMNGIELVRRLRQEHPNLRCFILSGHNSRVYVRQALAAGADGYLLKGDPLEIERGIAASIDGRQYVSRLLDDSTH